MAQPTNPVHLPFTLKEWDSGYLLAFANGEPTNTLSRSRVIEMTRCIEALAKDSAAKPLTITGNEHFFSAGADLNEIVELHGSVAYDFALMGQRLMRAIEEYPSITVAAIRGYCMGGGLDLALACRHRVAAPNAIFGHRGAALGLITGWGGTQRLPRIVGKGRALQMFLCAEKLTASQALAIGLADEVSEDPLAAAAQLLRSHREL